MINDKTLRLILRYLVEDAKDADSATNMTEQQFYSLQVSDILEALGGDIGDALQAIKLLDAKGWIRIHVWAGDGAGYTHFYLTDEGLRQVQPTATGTLIKKYGSRALLYSFSTLGIIGGPLALANILADRVLWNEPIAWAVSFWDVNVTQPIHRLLSVPLQWFGIEGFPVWAADYVALGILVLSTFLRASRVEGQYTDLTPRYPAGVSARIVRAFVWLLMSAIGVVFVVSLWPLILSYEIVYTTVVLRKYEEIKYETLGFIDRDSAIARLVTILIPIVVFLLMVATNYLFL